MNNFVYNNNYFKNSNREFPGGPVVRTPRFHCRGPRFNGGGTKILQAACGMAKKKIQIVKDIGNRLSIDMKCKKEWVRKITIGRNF